jgi:uracil-DNA glycosylase
LMLVGEQQVSARLPWLQAEIAMVRLAALVCLGATAGKALPGSQVRIGRDRAEPMESELTELVTLTAHPSSIRRS